jgi:molecular chaperone GrpE
MAKKAKNDEKIVEKEENPEIQDNNEDLVDDCETQLLEAQKSVKDNWDKVLRGQAEIENLKRRHTQEIEKAHKYALDKFVKELLAVADSMTLGLKSAKEDEVKLESVVEGLEMTNKVFSDTLTKFGVVEINPVEGIFDSELHQAVTMVPMPDKKSNEIVEVVQVGWTLNERLVRPAMVVVAQ